MQMILLVDDYEEVREMLSRRLKRHGYEVAVAADGRQAIDGFDTVNPDLVLLDMKLPVMDGFSVARHLKTDPRRAGVPIIALSAGGTAEDRDRALQAGCNDYHPKPLDFSRLLEQIRAALGLARADESGVQSGVQTGK